MADEAVLRSPSPSLAIAGRYSFAFTFFQRLPLARKQKLGVRVPALLEFVRRDRTLYRELVEPPLSFFRDIVDADQGPVSMPLVAAIDPARGEAGASPADHDVDVILPAALHYDAESRHVVLEPPRAGGDRILPFAFRDAIAIFESGHIAYVFSLVPRPGRPLVLSEYDVIVLEKLVSPSESCEYLRREIQWRRADGRAGSLVELVNERLAAARASSSRAPNAIRDLVYHTLLERGEELAAWTWADLRSMAIVLDDETLQAATCLALEPAGGGEGAATAPGPDGAPARERGGSGPGAGAAGAPGGPGGGPRPHMAAERTPGERVRLALAGMTQGVLDFPEQDMMEVGDSLGPVLAGQGVEIFSHPRFLIEVCHDSRSLAAMEHCLGCCPYIFLSHLVFAYNKRLLEDAEASFEELRRHRRGRRFRYRPFETLGDIINAIDFPVGRPTRLLHANLRVRFELLRDLIISYIPNVFRYHTERALYDALSAKHGLRGRYDTFVDWLRHYEDIVRGVHDLGQLLADRRANRLLLIIAVGGLLSVAKDTAELVGLSPLSPRVTVPLVAMVGALVGLVAAREIWVIARSRWRARDRRERGGQPPAEAPDTFS